ncbi:MAG: chemotaxis protein CheB [Acidobacteriota bacterium]
MGASAGGLAAFEAFFSAMPSGAEPGMAFVLVQHLAPDHKSILSELFRRYTRMAVSEVESGMVVRPNCAYIIPPNRDMALLNGTLQLLEPAMPRGLRLPIDFFFRSLAQDQRERAIGIVLSGTGSDGTLGVRAIKGEGGMAMAQDPSSTEYDSMPRNAIATGLVDYVLPPAAMPAQLIAFVGHALGTGIREAPASAADDGTVFRKICILLRAHTGHDFSLYKPTTISRRVERRLALHQIRSLDDYVRYLRQSPAELDALFRDLLIGVTSLFRDPEAFAALEAKAIPRILAGRPATAPIRVWVPGCSTGEEAYSIAIALHEQLDERRLGHKVQVFATDIDSRAIEQARSGVFPASIAADVAPGRLACFFTQEADGGAYRVSKRIRDALVVSVQDLIRDPPFSRLDLISCRNVLIYMSAELQKQLMPLFHYALSPGGILFLGTSETIGEYSELFATLDRKGRLYERRSDLPGAARPLLPGLVRPARGDQAQLVGAGMVPAASKPQLRELTERALLQQYAPVGALVDGHGAILYLYGRSGLYLEPAPGEAALNILTMAREGLRRDLSNALHRAVTRGEVVRRPGLRVKTNGDFVTVNLTVRPVEVEDGTRASPVLCLVIIEEAPPADPRRTAIATAPEAEAEGAAAEAELGVAALRRELLAKEEYLQTTNEELQTSNEELRSSNEEMQSVNEELQSTNEELETSREELQSVNEELTTVNAELQAKVSDLARANNDLSNLLAATCIGTVFLDLNLHIQRFTPAATALINLIPSDVGRPVGHTVSNLIGYDRLLEDARMVLDTLIPKEIEVQSRAGAWFLLRVRPYRTLENVIEGVVLTFTDISEVKRAQAVLRESESLRRLAVMVRDSSDAVIVHELDGRIVAWNPRAEELYGWSEADALTMNLSMITPEPLRVEASAEVRRISGARTLEPYRTQRLARNGRVVDVLLTASALVNEAGETYAVVTTEREVVT